MHIPNLLSSVILLSVVILVSASDICAYTSRNCAGSFGCCSDIAQNDCCFWPSNYGWTFGDSMCSTQASGVGGSSSGPVCTSVYNGPTYLAWGSAEWTADTGARRDIGARDNANCVKPNVVGFTTEDGKEHLVSVPKEKFDEVNEWVKSDEFSKLLELDSV